MSVDIERVEHDFLLSRLIEQQAQLRESIDTLARLLESLGKQGLPQSMPKTLTVKEVADLIHVEPGTVRNWMSARKIPFHRANGAVFFLLEELLEWTALQATK